MLKRVLQAERKGHRTVTWIHMKKLRPLVKVMEWANTEHLTTEEFSNGHGTFFKLTMLGQNKLNKSINLNKSRIA